MHLVWIELYLYMWKLKHVNQLSIEGNDIKREGQTFLKIGKEIHLESFRMEFFTILSFFMGSYDTWLY